tara:strand:- start:421 stop:564 length:144 start_codon:yes stop_codon:yes gene_type:complete
MIYTNEARFNMEEEPDLTDQELKAIFEHDEFEDYLNSIPTVEERNNA